MSEEGLVVKDSVSAFVEKIVQADGDLVPLPGKTSKLGEPFFISVRHGADEVEINHQYLIIDVFAQRGEEFVPVGIYDWEIKGEAKTAQGNKQRHGHLPAQNPAHQAADRYWGTGEAFHVVDLSFLNYALRNGEWGEMNRLREEGIITDEEQWMKPIYQGEGLGGLMIAVSVLALQRLGIEKMDLGTLSSKAVRTWKGFGRENRQFIPTEELANHSKTKEAIKRFVG